MGNTRIKDMTTALLVARDISGIKEKDNLSIRSLQEIVLKDFVAEFVDGCKCDGTLYEGVAGNAFVRDKDGIKAKAYFREDGYIGVVTREGFSEFVVKKNAEGQIGACVNLAVTNGRHVVREVKNIENINGDTYCHTDISRVYKYKTDVDYMQEKDFFSLFNSVRCMNDKFNETLESRGLNLDFAHIVSKKIAGTDNAFNQTNEYESVGIFGLVSPRNLKYSMFIGTSNVEQHHDKLSTYGNCFKIDHARMMGRKMPETEGLIDNTISEITNAFGKDLVMGE